MISNSNESKSVDKANNEHKEKASKDEEDDQCIYDEEDLTRLSPADLLKRQMLEEKKERDALKLE